MGDTGADKLDIYRERPLSVRLTEFLARVVALLLLWPPMVLIWSIVLLFAFSFVFSRPVRHAGIGFWRDSIVVITMVLVQLLIAITVGRFLNRICYGRPWFGKLSKEPRSLVATVLRASNELSFRLDDNNRQLMQKLADLNRDIMKWLMGRQYRIIHSGRADYTVASTRIRRRLFRDRPDDIEVRWKDTWQEKVLESSSGGCTVAQAFEPDSYAWVTVPNRLTSLLSAVTGMTWFYETVVLWLLLSRLGSGSSLLPVFQVAVGFSVVTTLIIFLYHSYNLPDIYIISPQELMQQHRWTLMPKARREGEELTKALDKEFGERLGSFSGKSISIVSVKVSPRYLSLVRNYYARSLAYECVMDSLIGFVLILIATAFLWFFGIKGEPNISWLYTRLAIALALMPAAIVGIHFLIFTLVAQFRRFITLAVTGALITFTPLAANYLFAGRLPASPVAFASSAIAGIIGSAGADLALRNRKKITD